MNRPLFKILLQTLALVLVSCTLASCGSKGESAPTLEASIRPSNVVEPTKPLPVDHKFRLGDLIFTLPSYWADVSTDEDPAFFLSPEEGNLSAGYVSLMASPLEDWGLTLEQRKDKSQLDAFYSTTFTELVFAKPNAGEQTFMTPVGDPVDLEIREQPARIYPILLTNPAGKVPGKLINFVTENTNYIFVVLCAPGSEQGRLLEVEKIVLDHIKNAKPAADEPEPQPSQQQ